MRMLVAVRWILGRRVCSRMAAAVVVVEWMVSSRRVTDSQRCRLHQINRRHQRDQRRRVEAQLLMRRQQEHGMGCESSLVGMSSRRRSCDEAKSEPPPYRRREAAGLEGGVEEVAAILKVRFVLVHSSINPRARDRRALKARGKNRCARCRPLVLVLCRPA
jgi:hypothetical protein